MTRERLTLHWSAGPESRPARQVEQYVEIDGRAEPAPRPQRQLLVEAAPSVQLTPAIFESTGQAIHVAYVIMAQPAQQDSMLRKSLVRILGSMANLSPALSSWLGQLRGEKSGTVDFEGLSAYDVRAQCALILTAVRTRLPEPERWAIEAKYCATEDEGRDGEKRYAFSSEKAAAIKRLSAWLVQTSVLGSIPRAAMDLMVAKLYVNHTKTEISYRALAAEFGGDHLRYFRAFKKVKQILRPLEDMAIARLHPYFVTQGIVIGQPTDAA